MFCLLAVLVVVLVGCSSGKNTATTRWWQAFNTRYNVYYNGAQAYIEGSLEKETGNQDNFTEMIPLYTVGNKSSRDLGKTNFDKAIEKAEKAIKLHSIKKRPEWNKNRRKTAKDIEWLHRREYNPFLWKAWLLLGRAQFHKGDFDAAASTFAYMSRIYATQPAIYGRARAWLAKAYVENDLLYDAEDVIRNMQRDSIHWSAQKEWDYTYTDYYIHTGDYEQAVKYLRRVIRHEMRRKQKAREYYLLGQLETALGHNAEAAKAYRRVPRLNPPYELAFNARIALSEVLAASQSRQMIRKLKRMARATTIRTISIRCTMPWAISIWQRKTRRKRFASMSWATERPRVGVWRKACSCSVWVDSIGNVISGAMLAGVMPMPSDCSTRSVRTTPN